MNKAIIIGAGFGGLSLAVRLQAVGIQTVLLDKLDKPGGRGYVKEVDGFVFDMGPTVITVPHFIEELFELGGKKMEDYVKLTALDPFYRIYFDDGSYFDYNGDLEFTKKQITKIDPREVENYERFLEDAGKIFEKGFLELGFTYFGDPLTMFRVVPDLLRLDAVRNLFRFTSKYFKNPKLQRVFSFETLLIGGSPLRVPAIYSMIHFVEKTWGIHYAKGGTGALIRALTKLFQELGGEVRWEAEVSKIITKKKKAQGVILKNGEELLSDIVVSNADFAHTYMDLLAEEQRFWNPDWRLKRVSYSMSLVVIYFGFRELEPLKLKHHNIIFGERYRELLKEIFEIKTLSTEDFSQYLHIPTITDKNMAPKGCHTAYTLIPVPNKLGKIDWQTKGEELSGKVLDFLQEKKYIPRLKESLMCKFLITPDYFENNLNSYLGNAFGVEPILTQTAYFRPHNRSEDIKNLYLVGASTQPGAGTPSVMMSAKMTAELICKDFAI